MKKTSEILAPLDPNDSKMLFKNECGIDIVDRLKNQNINLNPVFQRHTTHWDDKKMSRFIESILIRFPVPRFFFTGFDYNKLVVVDGLQRLSSIKKFVIDKRLRLNGLEYLVDLNGKNYEQLDRMYKRRIEGFEFNLFFIRPETPEAVKKSIIKRIRC